MRFYLDEDQSDVIAEIARSQFGLDVTSAHRVGTRGTPDEAQLAYAAAERRCLVTRNGDDFRRLTTRFLIEQLPHAGVLIVPRSWPPRAWARIARALAYYHRLYPGDVPPYFVDYLHDPPA
jgi:predicted nuclease of predicted toxin-antitoxin system